MKAVDCSDTQSLGRRRGRDKCTFTGTLERAVDARLAGFRAKVDSGGIMQPCLGMRAAGISSVVLAMVMMAAGVAAQPEPLTAQLVLQLPPAELAARLLTPEQAAEVTGAQRGYGGLSMGIPTVRLHTAASPFGKGACRRIAYDVRLGAPAGSMGPGRPAPPLTAASVRSFAQIGLGTNCATLTDSGFVHFLDPSLTVAQFVDAATWLKDLQKRVRTGARAGAKVTCESTGQAFAKPCAASPDADLAGLPLESMTTATANDGYVLISGDVEPTAFPGNGGRTWTARVRRPTRGQAEIFIYYSAVPPA